MIDLTHALAVSNDDSIFPEILYCTDLFREIFLLCLSGMIVVKDDSNC